MAHKGGATCPCKYMLIMSSILLNGVFCTLHAQNRIKQWLEIIQLPLLFSSCFNNYLYYIP